MTPTDITRAFDDPLFNSGLGLAEAIDRHFTPDHHWRTDAPFWSPATPTTESPDSSSDTGH